MIFKPGGNGSDGLKENKVDEDEVESPWYWHIKHRHRHRQTHTHSKQNVWESIFSMNNERFIFWIVIGF